MKLISHTVEVLAAGLKKKVQISEQQFGFMPRKSTTESTG